MRLVGGLADRNWPAALEMEGRSRGAAPVGVSSLTRQRYIGLPVMRIVRHPVELTSVDQIKSEILSPACSPRDHRSRGRTKGTEMDKSTTVSREPRF